MFLDKDWKCTLALASTTTPSNLFVVVKLSLTPLKIAYKGHFLLSSPPTIFEILLPFSLPPHFASLTL